MDQKPLDKKLDDIIELLRARIEEAARGCTESPIETTLMMLGGMALVNQITSILDVARAAGVHREVCIEVLRAYADVIDLAAQEGRREKNGG